MNADDEDFDDDDDETVEDRFDKLEAMIEHNMLQIAYCGAMLDAIMQHLGIDRKIVRRKGMN